MGLATHHNGSSEMHARYKVASWLTCQQTHIRWAPLFLLCAHHRSRLSESLMYVTAWYWMNLLTPYTLMSAPISPFCTPQECVGCQKVWCTLLYGKKCIFSHHTHVWAPLFRLCAHHRCVYGVRKSDVSYPTHPEHIGCQKRFVGCQKVFCILQLKASKSSNPDCP